MPPGVWCFLVLSVFGVGGIRGARSHEASLATKRLTDVDNVLRCGYVWVWVMWIHVDTCGYIYGYIWIHVGNVLRCAVIYDHHQGHIPKGF